MFKIAHRGFSNNIYKDNSFEAFDNAYKNNFDMIEMDIQLCKSGEIILYHDTYLKNDLIKNINYEDLKKENIRSLNDFFTIYYKKGMKILFDIKGHHEGITKKLIDICNYYKLNYNNTIMASFNKIIISELKIYKKIHNFTLALISDNNFYYDEIKYQLNQIDIISINFDMYISCDKTLLDECFENNIKIIVWTIKNKFQINLLKKSNIYGLISDIILN